MEIILITVTTIILVAREVSSIKQYNCQHLKIHKKNLKLYSFATNIRVFSNAVPIILVYSLMNHCFKPQKVKYLSVAAIIYLLFKFKNFFLSLKRIITTIVQ